jgi:hypothetical protein
MPGCKGTQQTNNSTARKAKLAELEQEQEQLLEEEKWVDTAWKECYITLVYQLITAGT